MQRFNGPAGERGSAMVISLLALVLITMVGTLFMAQTKTETQISAHDMRSTQAMFNAEAGLGEVLARMSDDTDLVNYIGEPAGTATPGWGKYVVLANGNATQDPDYAETESDGLDNNLDGQIDEDGEHYPQVATKQTGGNEIDYPWVKVRYRLNATGQVVLFGDHDSDLLTPPQFNLLKGYPVIMVTAEGEQGSASRILEVDAVKRPFELISAAVYSESDDFKFNGTQFQVSGLDHDPVTGAEIPGNPAVPGLLTTEDPNNISGALTGQQVNNVEGSTGSPSVESSTVDLDLEAMAAEYASLAEHVVPTGTYSNVNWGNRDEYTVVHCTGDLHTSGNISGGGILIVDGSMSCTGSFKWYGLVIVLGNIDFNGGGTGIHIFGSVLAEGSISDEQVVAGNADLFYSSAALNKITALTPYQVLNWHELN